MGVIGFIDAGVVAGAAARAVVTRLDSLALPFGAIRLCGVSRADGCGVVARWRTDGPCLVRSRSAAGKCVVERWHGVGVAGVGGGKGCPVGVLADAAAMVERAVVSAGAGGRAVGRIGGRRAVAGPVGAAVRGAVSGGQTVAECVGLARPRSGAAVERAGLEFGGLGGFQVGDGSLDNCRLGVRALVRWQSAVATLECSPARLGGRAGILAVAGFGVRLDWGIVRSLNGNFSARRRVGGTGPLSVPAAAQYRVAGHGLVGGWSAGGQRFVGGRPGGGVAYRGGRS